MSGLGKSGLRGPYGSQEGDVWLASDEFQEEVKKRRGPTYRAVIEMSDKQDGNGVQEVFYITDNPALVERAESGHKLYLAEQASRN